MQRCCAAGESVQVFIGGVYVSTPQHYDYQQVEFDSTSASVVIPSGSAQTYYVTAYAQTIPVSPAAYTIQASMLQFSIASVSPNSVSNNGTATLTFTGGGFTSSTVFSLVRQRNGVQPDSDVPLLSASDQAQVAFSFTAIPTGVYTAQASNGGPVTLANALTVTTGSGPSNIVNAPGGGDISVWPELPHLSAAYPATLTEIAPPCSGCDPNLALKYGNTFNSGIVMGINHQGPAGVLPAGASDDSCVATYSETPIGIASITYPDGTHAYYTYDAAGRLIGTKGDGGNGAVTYAYNSNGTVTATDALGHSYVTQQNAIGPPVSITDPLGNQLQSRYDAEGKVT